MRNIPKHIPKKQHTRYLNELRRQGKMRTYIVSRSVYQRFEGGSVLREIYEAIDIKDLLEQLDR